MRWSPWRVAGLLGGLVVGMAVLALAGPAGDAISQMEAQLAALQQAVLQLQADLAALADRVTALEGAPPAPTSYSVTLTTSGTGSGTVGFLGARRRSVEPTRDYAAGETVTLTAQPASGSTFGGWAPAPCAPTFAMPAAALTCTATFTASVPPPSGGAGTWQRLPTGVDAQETFSFTQMVWDTTRNQALHLGWAYTPWCFEPLTNVWATCGQKGPSSSLHNGGYAYDPHNDRHWVSTASGTEPQSLMVYWQRATGTRVEHSVNGCGMDPAMIYHPAGKRFICFGGWTTPTDVPRILTFALDPPATAWTAHYPPTGPLFQESGDASKQTLTRAGWDAKRGTIWYVDHHLDLWQMNPAALTWTKQVTTGTKPSKFGIYQRHDAADRLVAWVGSDGISQGPIVRKTYWLDLTTFVWAEVTLPASAATQVLPPHHLAATAPVPPGFTNAQNQIVYDPVRQRILLHTGSNYTRETWAFTFAAGPPPVAQHTLTIQTAGTGTGTTTGAGTYPAGTAVTLTATPAAGSSFGGWAGHADCSDGAVTMDATKSCTATFTAQAAGGGCLPTVKQTFTPCSVPTNLDQSPFGGTSKDLMWTWDRTRNLIYMGLGDSGGSYTGGSGNTMVWSYDAATNTWATISTYCQPTGSASPNFPSDYGIMVHDPGRDRLWWLGQGDGFPPGQEGALCTAGTPNGSIRRNGWLWLTPGTNFWTKTSEQLTGSTGGAYFDSAGDRVINIEGQQGLVTAHAMGAMPTTKVVLANLETIGPLPRWTGTAGGWGWAEYTNRVKFAWDDVERIAYIPTIFRRKDVAGTTVESGAWMVTVNTVTKALAMKARAPLTPVPFPVNAYSTMTVWDSVNRKVIWPVMGGACGKIEKLLAYDPPSDTYEELLVPSGTHGATLAYDPVRNVVLFGGRVFCEDVTPPPNPPKVYLWRYAP